MLSLTKTDWSTTVVIVAWPPRSLSIAGSSSATALAMSTVLPLLALLIEMPMDAWPLVRVTAVSGAGPIATSATSPSLTGSAPAVAAADAAEAAEAADAPAVDAPAAPAVAPAAPAEPAVVAAAAAEAGGRTRSSIAFSVCAEALTVTG